MIHRQSIQSILLALAWLGMWGVTGGHAQGFERTNVRFGLPFDGGYYLGGDHGYKEFENRFAGGPYGNKGSWVTRDMTGDGLPDLVITGAMVGINHYALGMPDQHWRVYPGDGQNFSPQFIEWNLPEGGRLHGGFSFGYYHVTNWESPQNSDAGNEWWTTRDMNGDDLPDLVVTSAFQLPYYLHVFRENAQAYWKVYLNTGTGFGETAIQWNVPNGGFGTGPADPGFQSDKGQSYCVSQLIGQNWDMQDMDGDRDDDLVVMAECGVVFGAATQPYWLVYRNTGTGFEPTATTWPVPVGGRRDFFGNLLGFVEMDELRANATSDGSQVWKVMDMDDDGRPDLVVASERDSIDGLVTFGPSNNRHWRVYRNNGLGFDLAPMAWTLPQGGSVPLDADYDALASQGSGGPSSESWATEDLNADGRPDLVVTSQGSYSFGLSGNPFWKVYFNTGTGFSSNMYAWQVPFGGLTASGLFYGYRDIRSQAPDHYAFEAGCRSWDLLDMNGDGRLDFVALAVKSDAFQPAHVWEMYNGNTHWKVYLNTANPVAAAEAQAAANLTVFPNPAQDRIHLDLRGADGKPHTVQVHDVSGKLLYVSTFVPGQLHAIDVSGWSRGLYFVTVQTRSGRLVQKVAVE